MSLRVWLPLNGDLRQQGLDNYTINMMRGSEVYNNNGKIGKCFYSNGVNTIKINNIISDFYNYSGYSLCAWFYIESRNTTHTGSAIISAGNWNSQVLNLAISEWNTDHYTQLRVSGSNWNNYYSYTFNLNTWYHVVVSCNGNKTYAYVNGVLIGNTINSFLPTSIEGNNICIGGATYYNGMQFFGRINDVRIYDHALSAKEVKELSKGLVAHYTLDGNSMHGNENLFRGTSMSSIERLSGDFVANSSTDWTKYFRFYNGSATIHTFSNDTDTVLLNASGNLGIAFQRKATDINLDSSSYYTISCEAKCTKSGAHLDIGLSYYNTSNAWVWRGGTNPQNFTTVNTWQKFSLTFKPDSDIQYIMYCFTVVGTSGGTDTFSIRYCKLEKGYIATQWLPNKLDIDYNARGYSETVYDSSGFNNHAVKWKYDANGSFEMSNETKRNQLSTYINSANVTTSTASGTCYIYGYCNLVQPNYLSVSFWCKPILGYGGNGINGQGIFSLTNQDIGSGTASDYQQGPMNQRDSGIDINSASGSIHQKVNMAFTQNEWHHYAIVYDGRYGKAYKDAVLQNTIDMGSNTALGSMKGIVIGFSKAGGVFRRNQAYYSDFRLYTTALTAEDVLQLYNAPISFSKDGSVFTQGEFIEK